MSKEESFRKALERERLSRKQAERILENKSIELYQANQALENLNQYLEDKVEERTQELVIQKNRAEKLARVKSDFLSMLSHEIKNPLNAVIGYAELMAMEEINEDASVYLTKIQNSSNILLGLINDILVYSKADSDKLDISISKFSLRDEVEKIITVFEQDAFKKGLNLFVNCPDVKVYTDKQKLSQILINLIGNSLKFTESGFVEINLRIENNNEEKKLFCEVKDTGIGIKKNEIQKIFSPFVQVGDNKTFHKGTGLGLAITKKLVTLLDGEIKVECQKTGCLFVFNIKLGN